MERQSFPSQIPRRWALGRDARRRTSGSGAQAACPAAGDPKCWAAREPGGGPGGRLEEVVRRGPLPLESFREGRSDG